MHIGVLWGVFSLRAHHTLRFCEQSRFRLSSSTVTHICGEQVFPFGYWTFRRSALLPYSLTRALHARDKKQIDLSNHTRHCCYLSRLQNLFSSMQTLIEQIVAVLKTERTLWLSRRIRAVFALPARNFGLDHLGVCGGKQGVQKANHRRF